MDMQGEPHFGVWCAKVPIGMMMLRLKMVMPDPRYPKRWFKAMDLNIADKLRSRRSLLVKIMSMLGLHLMIFQ